MCVPSLMHWFWLELCLWEAFLWQPTLHFVCNVLFLLVFMCNSEFYVEYLVHNQFSYRIRCRRLFFSWHIFLCLFSYFSRFFLVLFFLKPKVLREGIWLKQNVVANISFQVKTCQDFFTNKKLGCISYYPNSNVLKWSTSLG